MTMYSREWSWFPGSGHAFSFTDLGRFPDINIPNSNLYIREIPLKKSLQLIFAHQLVPVKD
jgi:hypothetical protein